MKKIQELIKRAHFALYILLKRVFLSPRYFVDFPTGESREVTHELRKGDIVYYDIPSGRDCEATINYRWFDTNTNSFRFNAEFDEDL